MLTAHNLRCLNEELKLSFAKKTAKDVEDGLFNPEVTQALAKLASGIQSRTRQGLPYQDNCMSVWASTIISQKNYNELTTVLRNLGYEVEFSCSSNWCNEQLTISW